MELRIYVQMIQRSWWIVTVTALSALAIALASTLAVTPVYRTNARFVISPNLARIGEKDLVRSLEALDKRSIVVTYAEVLNSDLIYENAFKALQMQSSALKEYSHSTVVLPEANILELTVQGSDPNIVAALANNIGQQAIEYIQQLYSVYDLKFLDAAVPPSTPIRPQPLRDASMAFALGLIVGAVLAILREFLRTPLESLLQRTIIDGASQAYNRDFVTQRLEETVLQSESAILALGMVRLDGFETFLQMMPVSISQQVLRQVVQTMKNELRGNDIVGRWTDTTFAILLPNTPGSAAVSTLGRVQFALSKPIQFTAEGETLHLYPKIGIVERQPGTATPTIIEQADKALNQATHGKSGLVLFRNKVLAAI